MSTVDLDIEEIEVRLYECAILFPVDLPQKEEQELIREIEGLFAEAGAKQVFRDVWGQRGIAYKIKGKTEGKFIIYNYELDPSKLREIDHALRIMKNLMRHMFVKPPKGYQTPKWSERYEQWLKERETVDEVRAREREEKLQEQVARKAKKQAERVTTERKRADDESTPVPKVTDAELTEQLDKIISDDTFDNL